VRGRREKEKGRRGEGRRGEGDDGRRGEREKGSWPFVQEEEVGVKLESQNKHTEMEKDTRICTSWLDPSMAHSKALIPALQ
jgi:hypothetical protein